jgi:5'(3')-deoxyribonucleotidase
MPVLYLDMDGVVADFNSYVESIVKYRHDQDMVWSDAEWSKVRDRPRLYRDLAKTTEADELVNYCREYATQHGYELRFLTAVPRKNDMMFAFYDKVIWAEQYFPNIPVMFGPFSHNKQEHCRPGDILIDDRTSNITEWRAAGGHGILHQGNFDKTVTALECLI